MDTNLLVFIVQLLTPTVALITALILYISIKSNNKINQRIIFNEIVKQERELRIKLSEYREEIHKRLKISKNPENFKEITLDYDTLLFNYYEYVALCIHQKLVNERETKIYFRDLLREVREKFEDSILFEEKYADKNQYKCLQWLFRKWKINY